MKVVNIHEARDKRTSGTYVCENSQSIHTSKATSTLPSVLYTVL